MHGSNSIKAWGSKASTGASGSPRWDKVILATSPAPALATWFYHAVEHHAVTRNRTELVLVSWGLDTLHQMQRISAGFINMFSCGYAYPQMQLEAGRIFNMLLTEKATQKIWNIQHSAGLNMSRTVGLFYTWSTGWAWTFNVPINIVEIAQTGPQHQLWHATRQCLQYSGLQCLDAMPSATAALMKQHLGRQHRLMVGEIGQIQVKDLGYNGQRQQRGSVAAKAPQHGQMQPTLAVQQRDRGLSSWQHGHRRWGQQRWRWTWSPPWLTQHWINNRGETATPLD